MAPSITELGPIFAKPGALLGITKEGARAINVALLPRMGKKLHQGSALRIQAIDPVKTHLRLPGLSNATISVDNDLDLFETPLQTDDQVRISRHTRHGASGKELCPSTEGKVTIIFVAPVESGGVHGNAQCNTCGFTETVGPGSKLNSEEKKNGTCNNYSAS